MRTTASPGKSKLKQRKLLRQRDRGRPCRGPRTSSWCPSTCLPSPALSPAREAARCPLPPLPPLNAIVSRKRDDADDLASCAAHLAKILFVTAVRNGRVFRMNRQDPARRVQRTVSRLIGKVCLQQSENARKAREIEKTKNRKDHRKPLSLSLRAEKEIQMKKAIGKAHNARVENEKTKLLKLVINSNYHLDDLV